MALKFDAYSTDGFYDELFLADGKPRPAAQPLVALINELEEGELLARQQAAEAAFMNNGITFAVYGNEAGADKIIPFDIIPRFIEAEDWTRLEKGLKQRTLALNLFLNDIYGSRKCIRDNIVPESMIETCSAYLPQMQGFVPPRGVWAHITGTDLVRDTDGTFYVLEDNMRCPSGVSYVLQNRQVLKRTFPRVFSQCSIRPVDEYCSRLRSALEYMAADAVENPKAVVLTPGTYNSAYYEH